MPTEEELVARATLDNDFSNAALEESLVLYISTSLMVIVFLQLRLRKNFIYLLEFDVMPRLEYRYSC